MANIHPLLTLHSCALPNSFHSFIEHPVPLKPGSPPIYIPFLSFNFSHNIIHSNPFQKHVFYPCVLLFRKGSSISSNTFSIRFDNILS